MVSVLHQPRTNTNTQLKLGPGCSSNWKCELLSSVKQGEARGAFDITENVEWAGEAGLVRSCAVSRLILYIILYSYYNVSPSVRTVKSGSVVPAAAEGSNSHLQHTLHTSRCQQPHSSRQM